MSSASTTVTIAAPYVPLTIAEEVDPTVVKLIRENNSAFAKQFQSRDFFQLVLFNQQNLPIIYRLEKPKDFPFQEAGCKDLLNLTTAAKTHETVIKNIPWTPSCASESCWSNTKIGVLLVIGLGCAVFLSYPFGENTPLNAIAAITVVRTAIIVLKHLKDVRDLRSTQKIHEAEKALEKVNERYELCMADQVERVNIQANFCLEAWVRATPHERYEPALQGKLIKKRAQKELLLSAMEEWRVRSAQLQACIRPLVRKESDITRLLKPLEDLKWAIIFSHNRNGLDSVKRNMRILANNSILPQMSFCRELQNERLDELLRDLKGGPRKRERKQQDLEERYGPSSAATDTTTVSQQQQQKPPSPVSSHTPTLSVSSLTVSVEGTQPRKDSATTSLQTSALSISLAPATATPKAVPGSSLTLNSARRPSTVQQQQQQQKPQMTQAHSQPLPAAAQQQRPATATRKSQSNPATVVTAQPEVGTLPNQPRANTPLRSRSPAASSHTKQTSAPSHKSSSRASVTAAATPPKVVSARTEFGKAAQPKVPAKR